MVDLNWTVLDESAMSGYEILYSHDGTTFNTVGFISAVNSQLQHQYNFVHPSVSNITNYYRLKMVELDGSYTYSPIITIKGKEQSPEVSVTVSPNPVMDHGKLIIQTNDRQTVQISILNSVGAQVASFSRAIDPGMNFVILPIERFSKAGIYFIKVKMTNKVITSKFILVR
jgi:hypothetical protein